MFFFQRAEQNRFFVSGGSPCSGQEGLDVAPPAPRSPVKSFWEGGRCAMMEWDGARPLHNRAVSQALGTNKDHIVVGFIPCKVP